GTTTTSPGYNAAASTTRLPMEDSSPSVPITAGLSTGKKCGVPTGNKTFFPFFSSSCTRELISRDRLTGIPPSWKPEGYPFATVHGNLCNCQVMDSQSGRVKDRYFITTQPYLSAKDHVTQRSFNPLR